MRLVESAPQVQFSLRSLLEYITLCCILLSAFRVVGVTASVALMLMALALWMRQGIFALVMWMTASLAADIPWNANSEGSAVFAQLMSIALVGGIVSWYRGRYNFADGSPFRRLDPHSSKPKCA